MPKKIDDGVLHKFYVVTCNGSGGSLYEVSDAYDENHGHATAKKIALHGESLALVGRKFGADMIAVCDTLIAYCPKSKEPSERRIDRVDSNCWRGGTCYIVALFFDLPLAAKCFGEPDHMPCDPRWRKQTKAVIKAIGDEHQFFSVSHSPQLQLLR